MMRPDGSEKESYILPVRQETEPNISHTANDYSEARPVPTNVVQLHPIKWTPTHVVLSSNTSYACLPGQMASKTTAWCYTGAKMHRPGIEPGASRRFRAMTNNTSGEVKSCHVLLATANFTTKPPML